ncbi:MAG: hypothetical protein AAGA23_04435 [Pseudomonadota bacterium]
MRRRILLFLGAGMLLSALTLVQYNRHAGEGASPEASLTPPVITPTEEPAEKDKPGAKPHRVLDTRAAAAPETQQAEFAAPSPDVLGPLAPGESVDTWLTAMLQGVLKTPAAQARTWRSNAEGGDAAAAFRQHVLAMLCLHGPRTDWQLERRLEDLNDRLDKLGELDEAQAAQQVEYIQIELREAQATNALCAHIDPELDLRVEALEWLETAAELGHRGAQRVYPFFGRSLILGWEGSLAFEQPGLVEEYQLRARRYGEALLATGHPEAYLMMSELYFDGSAFPRDYARSYAYALAAEWLEGGQVNRVTQMRMRLLDGRVSPEDKEHAMTLASELLAERP